MKMKHVAFGITSLLFAGIVGVARAEIDDKQFATAFEKYAATDKGQELLGKSVQEYFKNQQARAQAAEAEDLFKNPAKIDVGESPVKGPADAKITIIEFSDFQCPYCKRGKENMDAVMKAYPNQVKLSFKHMPLPFHQQATPAAKAAYAAGKQGKFWEMHDALFNNQEKLGAALFEEQAKTLGLDLAKFKADMASPDAEKEIKENVALATKNGIQGTPGFFVNGVAVKGAYPVEHFKMIIDRLLGGEGAAAPKK